MLSKTSKSNGIAAENMLETRGKLLELYEAERQKYYPNIPPCIFTEFLDFLGAIAPPTLADEDKILARRNEYKIATILNNWFAVMKSRGVDVLAHYNKQQSLYEALYQLQSSGGIGFQ